ncbi:sortase B [Granulicatella balaenopterae]|uniref:Sortase B n=1 Tax=Granulicatella balaenopterae TaxID=137733 RepID=A0A1H9NU11_9LACT|nr:class B sortase [Granulicatella balaenopterae]SER39388.1 sortase B [Granulicatella balaenopterae]
MATLKKIVKFIIVIILFVSMYNITLIVKDGNDTRRIYKEIREKKEELDLNSINSEYMGWITIKDTPIDYPIVKGSNNDYYLTRDFNKQYLSSGSIFMDYRNEGFQDKNTVIYGHHMKNGTMFGSLKKYKDKDYLEKNKIIHIMSKNHEKLTYEIFSVYTTTSDDAESIVITFNNEEEFSAFINNICNKSIYDSDVEVKVSDRILTLSTCSYDFEDARLVIHARLID